MKEIDFLLKYTEFHEKQFTLGKVLLDLLSIALVIMHFVIWVYYVPDSGCTSHKVSNTVILGGIVFVFAEIGLGWLNIRAARAIKLYKIFSPFRILVALMVIIQFIINCN